MTRARGEEFRTMLVCVDACTDGVLSGRFYNPFQPDGKAFQSLSQFLIQMDRTLDDMDFPRAAAQMRTFSKDPPPGMTFPETVEKTGRQATFAVRILFRQNASWQGSVKWLEGKQEQTFRSALELIFLMNSALNDQQAAS